MAKLILHLLNIFIFLTLMLSFTLSEEMSKDAFVDHELHNILYKVKLLKNIVSYKENAMNELRKCYSIGVEETRYFSNDSDKFPADKMKFQTTDLHSVLNDIKVWLEKEIQLVKELRDNINKLFPRLTVLSYEDPFAREMANALRTLLTQILSKTSDDIDLGKLSQEPNACGNKSFNLVKYPELVKNVSYEESPGCSRAHALHLPSGNYVTHTYHILTYCSARGRVLWKKKYQNEISSVVYLRHETILVEVVGETFKSLQTVDLEIRDTIRHWKDHPGWNGLGIGDGKIFTLYDLGKMYVIKENRTTINLYKHIVGDYYESLNVLPSAPNSVAACLVGGAVGHIPTVIRGTGERVCTIVHPNIRSDKGFMTTEGSAFIPSKTGNAIYHFKPNCQLSAKLVLPNGWYTNKLSANNGTLYVENFGSRPGLEARTLTFSLRDD